MDPRELRRVFGLFATGVTVITAVGPGPEPVGVTATRSLPCRSIRR
ncbi:MAG: hypothetical protein ACO3C6_09310 [Steroidobacteraceae bacterium]